MFESHFTSWAVPRLDEAKLPNSSSFFAGVKSDASLSSLLWLLLGNWLWCHGCTLRVWVVGLLLLRVSLLRVDRLRLLIQVRLRLSVLVGLAIRLLRYLAIRLLGNLTIGLLRLHLIVQRLLRLRLSKLLLRRRLSELLLSWRLDKLLLLSLLRWLNKLLLLRRGLDELLLRLGLSLLCWLLRRRLNLLLSRLTRCIIKAEGS